MFISSVDNSLTSPAIVTFELNEITLEIISMNYFNVICDKPKKKDPEIYSEDKDHIVTLRGYTDFYDRIIRKNKFIADRIIESSHVAIENYSFSSVGLVYQIGECGGNLKTMLYLNNQNLRTYEPTSIKLFFSGKGNAKKYDMFRKYVELGNPLGLSDKLMKIGFDALDKYELTGKVKSFNPVEDIVDAYAIATLLHTELLLRRGLIAMKELTEKQIQTFNTIHRDIKTNILNMDFIKKV